MEDICSIRAVLRRSSDLYGMSVHTASEIYESSEFMCENRAWSVFPSLIETRPFVGGGRGVAGVLSPSLLSARFSLFVALFTFFLF